ncbi:MAG: saccharopine dehydrogenase C-terminal domain-containing protein [Candidatus Fermentibacteraceae bacterium]
MKVTVLGAGRVGGEIAADLLRSGHSVTCADISGLRLSTLADGVEGSRADLSEPPAVRKVTEGRDLAVCAVPGHMGFRTLRCLLETGIDVVDISFAPENPLGLDNLARRSGSRCLVDMGVAPGCSNLFLGHLLGRYESLRSFRCLVGGLPQERVKPWEYRAPFSPVDVIEEYTRLARIVRGGQIVSLPALSDPEPVDIPGVGRLEAFLTDGLRSLLRFAPRVPRMEEKTLRYPGHRDLVACLRDSGFFDTKPLPAPGGGSIVPLEATTAILLQEWDMEPEDRDLTAMVLEAETREGERFRWTMVDRYDPETGTTSMARTTGYTCTAGVGLISRGLWSRPGVSAPEDVGGDPECFRAVVEHLESRGVVFGEG